jgi:hypothetical protein
MEKNITLFVMITCAVLLAGCESVQEDLGWKVNPQSTELNTVQPNDVPVPDGFTVVTRTRESYSVAMGSGGFRDAHLVYVGKTPPRKIARFYERNMVLPTFGWQDKSDYQSEGDRELKFVKGGAICTVVIREVPTDEDVETRIEVDIVSKA